MTIITILLIYVHNILYFYHDARVYTLYDKHLMLTIAHLCQEVTSIERILNVPKTNKMINVQGDGYTNYPDLIIMLK